MVVYNVTMNVDSGIEKDWFQWMKDIHIKNVIETGYFVDCKVFQLISDEPQGTTYAFQYFADAYEDVLKYQEEHGARLQMEVVSRYGDKVMSFRTMLEQVHQHIG
ncbi:MULTISPECIES: DUF4286 family protein [Reichenbachiella]|uniref:DUF4286 domain-containing protein n=1 Tax=Reichenbachiella agariperforans TaxID=156994 RepID=A0A1M6NPT2_REIAG|nr:MULTISPECIES: DUF4286 family protein [Reichenbachiella]MBU2915984.1 DUF4286 family protein [Reichenbachiella agariperforans]RJE71777.1 hypothetical protein BGP76_06725 [Reichenbachiella sp. MSK19-1]SHJ97757.1 protein of unknown function [Reichenbachiella agariperforans]